jgi:predicted RNA-binding Zn-ribbon protein involved in translation (DUF1610 family)
MRTYDMTESLIESSHVETREWNNKASLLICPRCGSDTLHHERVTSFDRAEDASQVVKTAVFAGNVSVDPAASNTGNPSSRRDGIVIDFTCEQCGNAPLQLTIGQHKGSTEIGWRFQGDAATA